MLGHTVGKIFLVIIISHVFKRAEEANIGEVVVATDNQEILEDVLKNGGKAILTNKNHKTGKIKVLINCQTLNIFLNCFSPMFP